MCRLWKLMCYSVQRPVLSSVVIPVLILQLASCLSQKLIPVLEIPHFSFHECWEAARAVGLALRAPGACRYLPSWLLLTSQDSSCSALDEIAELLSALGTPSVPWVYPNFAETGCVQCRFKLQQLSTDFLVSLTKCGGIFMETGTELLWTICTEWTLFASSYVGLTNSQRSFCCNFNTGKTAYLTWFPWKLEKKFCWNRKKSKVWEFQTMEVCESNKHLKIKYWEGLSSLSSAGVTLSKYSIIWSDALVPSVRMHLHT